MELGCAVSADLSRYLSDHDRKEQEQMARTTIIHGTCKACGKTFPYEVTGRELDQGVELTQCPVCVEKRNFK